MQGFALLMRAQQILIAHLERLDHGGGAPQEALLEETAPESILEQPLIKVFKVPVALCHLQIHSAVHMDIAVCPTPYVTSHKMDCPQLIVSCISSVYWT